MYSPAPFLISTAALTSIFSFFFGGYFREREWAYRFWIRYLAYDGNIVCKEEQKAICAELESKERVYRQAKGILCLLLFTLVLDFVVFQYYSLPYVFSHSPYFTQDAMHTYLCFSLLIGTIVLINCFQLIYIQAAIERIETFPFFKIRKRVTGQDRLSMLWRSMECHQMKNDNSRDNKIPKRFYRDKKRNKNRKKS